MLIKLKKLNFLLIHGIILIYIIYTLYITNYIIIFNNDSYILCALFSRNAIQVFSLSDKEWKCRINEGTAGIRNVYWAPDSRYKP